MIYRSKKRIVKKWLAAAILAGVLVIATVSAILAQLFLGAEEKKSAVSVPPEVIAGEARQNGMPLAYPAINKKSDIKFINIVNSTGEYGFILSDDNEHRLYYIDENGEQVLYYPDICADDPNFSYSNLFAIETSDGFGQYSLVSYLCLALQSPYFSERIALSEDEAEREKQLKSFGFDSEKSNSVSFTAVTELGATVNKSVKIGEKTVTGTGYYFIVYDEGVERPYIYSSRSNYFDYAISNMNVFVKPLLVSPGLAEDKGYGPYLTTGYYQWKNEYFDGSCACDKYVCECKGVCEEDCSCTDGCRVTEVPEESKVIIYADTIFPSTLDGKSSENTGYKSTELDLWTIAKKLSELKCVPDFAPSYDSKNYERALAALVGKHIGKYEGASEIIFSFVKPSAVIDFGDAENAKYSYSIKSIVSLVTDSGETVEHGVPVGDAELVKVVYTVTLPGKASPEAVTEAVIDLTSPSLPESAVAAIRAASVGEATDISFDVEYTTENAIKKTGKYIITELVEIYDQKGKEISAVASDSIVGYRYEIIIDGVSAGESTFWLDLSKVEAGSRDEDVKKALINKRVGKLSLEFDEYHSYYECFLGYTTYRISEIKAFVTRELVSSFRFQNSSERDPYYGESIYENLMGDEHELYGLNASICEKVVRILGGSADDSVTGTAAGLSGDKVEAIGLTPEVMEKFGLYANTVYFELPRGIKDANVSNNDGTAADYDDYVIRSTLGFTLYISDVDPETNMRYIASDLYGIVTRVAAHDFVYLDYDFETFWARRSIMLVDLMNVANIGIEFNMADLKGNYNFEITPPADKKTDSLGVFVTASGECTKNKFTEFISDPKNAHLLYEGGASLKTLYLYESGADEETHKDAYPNSLGASCFGDLIRMIFYTSYTGILGEEERGEAPSSEDSIMRMTLELDEDTPNAKPYIYVYEFFRIDDRRVRVSIHRETPGGEVIGGAVSDFYLSTYAFKKIASGFYSILNAEVIDIDFGYYPPIG